MLLPVTVAITFQPCQHLFLSIFAGFAFLYRLRYTFNQTGCARIESVFFSAPFGAPPPRAEMECEMDADKQNWRLRGTLPIKSLQFNLSLVPPTACSTYREGLQRGRRSGHATLHTTTPWHLPAPALRAEAQNPGMKGRGLYIMILSRLSRALCSA